jgi:PAS domain S-box-containing protein
MRVLVVEDEVQIRNLVRSGLDHHHIAVEEAGSVAEADEALECPAFDVVILDLTLPDGSGIEVLQHLNERFPHSHVIVLSGAVTELDRIRGLELGADDYVVKPFSARELTARVLAVRRRRTAPTESSICFGRFELDLSTRRLLLDGNAVAMSESEFALLAFLAARAGHVFSRDELLSTVWKSDAGWKAHASVTEHVRRVRRKIEVDPHRPLLLRTVRGVGYCFDLPRGGELDAAGEVIHERGTVTTVDGRIVHADPAALALLGTPDPPGLIGAHVLDFVAPQSLRSARERIRQVAAGAEGRSQVLLVLHPDGSQVPLEITPQTTSWREQDAVELQLRHAADVSPHLRHFVTGLLSDVTDAVVITDMNLHVRSWNGAAERLYGWTEAEVLGRHVLDVVGTTGDQPELGAAHAGSETAYRWHGSIEQTTRDGSTIAVRTSMSVVRDETGAELGIVSVNRPVRSEAADNLEMRDNSGDIRRGLATGEFLVHYQPVVSLVDEHVVTVEALVRWDHPEDGLLGPDSFIEVAERTDVIRELGAFVLATACRQVALWRSTGTQVTLAVNLSAREFADPLLVEHITETVGAAGLELSALWLEVTETALVEDVVQASVLLHELAGLGIGISIDDFGTGWASLTYLRQFPVHALKIDRSFVTGVDHDPNSATIIRSILALGAELGLVVVAEGIETRAEADALKSLGCTVGQGYLYARPMPAAEIDLTRMWPMNPGPTPSGPVLSGPAAGGPTWTDIDAAVEAAVVTRVLRRLLRIRSAAAAAALLQQTVEELGGDLVLTADACEDSLPIDVSLGEGVPLLPRACLESVTRMRIERVIPGLAEDARQAIELLRREERLTDRTEVRGPSGVSGPRGSA